MRYVIDLQCAQSESRFRGIGRYSIGLARSIARLIADEGRDEVFIFLNETIADAAAHLRAEFADLVPPHRICGFYSVGDTAGQDVENNERRGVSEVIRETALAALRPDAVLVMSLFEGFGGSAVTSIRGFVAHLPTAVILYDLIPMMAPDKYLSNPVVRAWYERKVASLCNADLLFAISDTAREQAVSLLGLPHDRLVTIGTGLDDRFRTEKGGTDVARQIFAGFGIDRPAVLYAGGFDRRKNLDVLIEAFAGIEIALRETHQLVVAGKCPLGDLTRLTRMAESCGLTSSDVIFTGHVTDEELVTLYQRCELFVFPSTLEGFGLPPLEALACGAPVLSVETPSMVGLHQGPDLLVEPGVEPLRIAIEAVLQDPLRLAQLKVSTDDLAARFDWRRVAEKALLHLHELASRAGPLNADLETLGQERPTLAVVAPLPSMSDSRTAYLVELVPALHQHYAVELVVEQVDIDTSWIPEWIPLRSSQWFLDHGDEFDRILYYIDDSPLSALAESLLMRFPGTVVLQDFFLGNLERHRQDQTADPGYLEKAVAYSHGPAGGLLVHECGLDSALRQLPCNLRILEAADSVIVPSDASIALTEQWFGHSVARKLVDIAPTSGLNRLPPRMQARSALGMEPQDVVVCVLALDPSRVAVLIDAWRLTDQTRRGTARLVFLDAGAGNVGVLRDAWSDVEGRERVEIVSTLTLTAYRTYLAAADIALFLCVHPASHADASIVAAMSANLALVVTESDEWPEMPRDVVRTVAADVTADELASALDAMISDAALRTHFAKNASRFVRDTLSPASLARRYATAIESGARYSPRRHAIRLRRFAVDWATRTKREPWQLGQMAQAAAQATTVLGTPRLFVDVSSIAAFDLRTGIQRVVRALLLGVMRSAGSTLRVEPVRADIEHRQYRYASRYMSALLDLEAGATTDEVIEPRSGDIFLGLDLAGEFVTVLPEWFRVQSDKGVRIVFVAYDLLPIRLPEYFPEGMDIAFSQWLQTIGKVADEVLCISESVATDLVEWLEQHKPLRRRPLGVGSFHLGADLGASAPTRGLPPEAASILDSIAARPTFLMVGTVEPRKGHAQVLAAFEHLWQSGHDVGLVIVGKAGWMMDPFLDSASRHPQFGKSLFWLERISDEFLDRVYPACVALIAASHGEGFGLPLIESAQHLLPIIARDLPVFREVAGDHAFYFAGSAPGDLSCAITEWISLRRQGLAPTTEGFEFHSWKESAEQVLALLHDPSRLIVWNERTSIALGERLPFDSVKLDWEGWSSIERSHRWSEGKQSRIGFFLTHESGTPQTLEMMLGTYGEQKVVVYLNEVCVYDETVVLTDDLALLKLPRDALLIGEQNWIEFRLPTALSPGDHDRRRIALYLKWLCLQ